MVEVIPPRTSEIKINYKRYLAFFAGLAFVVFLCIWLVYSSSWGAGNPLAEWLRKYLSVANRFRPNAKPEDNLASALRIHGIEKLGEKNYAVLFTATTDKGDPVTIVQPAEIEIQLGNDASSRQKAYIDKVIPLNLVPEQDLLTFAGVLDYSASMFVEDLSAVESNYSVFLKALALPFAGTIIKFNDAVNKMNPLTNDKKQIETAVATRVAVGNTALYSGINRGIMEIRNRRWMRFVLLTTDGNDNASDYTLENVIDEARKHFISVFVFGFGWLNVGVLKRIAEETDGYYVYVPDSSSLSSWFPKIAGIINNVQVAEVSLPISINLPCSIEMKLNLNGKILTRSR